MPSEDGPTLQMKALSLDASLSKLMHVARGAIRTIAVLPDGQHVLSGFDGGKVILTELKSGYQLREFNVTTAAIGGIAPLQDQNQAVMAGLSSGTYVWDLTEGRRLRDFGRYIDHFLSVRLHPNGKRILGGTISGHLVLSDVYSREELCRFRGHTDAVSSIDILSNGHQAISGSFDGTLRLWDLETGREIYCFDGQGGRVWCVAAMPDGKRAISSSEDGRVRIWDLDGQCSLSEFGSLDGGFWPIVVLGDGKRCLSSDAHQAVLLWDLEAERVLRRMEGHIGRITAIAPLPDGKHFVTADEYGYISTSSIEEVTAGTLYTSARIALLGESGVGKTGLGWRIAHGTFRDHPSTHGQQFWVVDRISATGANGIRCEAVLWDLAGQPDYRLIHALFLSEVDIGLILFDPTNRDKPLSDVEYWVKHLGASTQRLNLGRSRQEGGRQHSTAPTLLIAARSDRGTATLTDEEILAFCQRYEIAGFVRTSALDNIGIEDLLARIRTLIPWQRLTATVTTETFKRIKDHVLRLKEAGGSAADVLLPLQELREQLRDTESGGYVEDGEILTAVHHLANHGYVVLIQRVDGNHSILLASDLLANLAASVVLEARRHERGLGMIDEERLLRGDYPLPELSELTLEQKRTLLDEVVRMLLHRNICFRETVNQRANLVFPSLINEKRPAASRLLVDHVVYRVTGEVETLYPALVVQLGYTNLFHREHHWQGHAEYEFEPGHFCGFRQSNEQDGELELVLSYSPTADDETRTLFRSVFERFMKRRRVHAARLEAVFCANCGQLQERAAVQRAVDAHRPQLFCDACGTKLITPALSQIGMVPRRQEETLREATELASQRTKYEVGISWVKSFLRNQGDVRQPSCFISYAWGDPQHELWVEDLADHLQRVNVQVTFDKWHSRPGGDISEFVERIEACSFVCAVGTRGYLRKYRVRNRDPVVRAEVRLVNERHMKRGRYHDTVIPLLREGTKDEALPPLLRTSVHIDMRNDQDFLPRLFELVLVMHRIDFTEPMARNHRATIAGGNAALSSMAGDAVVVGSGIENASERRSWR